MTIRFDENGNPYDDGEYDYSQEAPQEEASQQEFIPQESSGGGEGDFNYEEEPVQENPVFVVDEPAADPYASADSAFVINDPMIDSSTSASVINPIKQEPPELYGFDAIYQAMTPAEKNAYDNEWERPIYIKGSNVRVDENDARIKLLEEARFKEQMNFAEKSAYDQAILAREMGGPDTRVPRDDGNLLAVTEQQPLEQKLNPLAPTSPGEYDYTNSGTQGPPPELKGSLPGISEAPASGTSTVSSSQFENARRTPFRRGQDGSRGQDGAIDTPLRDRFFGRKGRYIQSEPTINADSVLPEISVDPLAPTSVGEYDYRPASIQGPPPELKGSFPGISVDPVDDGIPTVKMIPANTGGLLAAAVGGQAIGQSGAETGPARDIGRSNKVMIVDNSVKYDPGVIKMADLPREDMPRPKIFTNEMNNPERILGYGFQQQRILDGKGPKDTAIDKFGRLLPDNGVFPVDNASTMGNESKPIAVREGALPNPMVEGQPRDIEKANAEKEQQRLKDLADWKIIQDKEDAVIKTKKDKALANELSEKQLADSIIKEENHKRDLAITNDPTRNDEEKGKAWERIHKFKDAELATQRKKEQVAHDEAVAEKVRNALNRFRGGTPLGEAKNEPEAPRQLQPLGLGKSGSIYDTFKGIDAKVGDHAKKIKRPVDVVNRNEGKDEQLGSYNFIASGPNGLTPKMFPLASQVFDATVAEKNLNEMKDMRYKELMDVSPTGALLKSQVKQQAIAKLLDDKSLNRVIDFVNEVHNSVTVGNTTENSTGTSNEISAKVSRSIPGSSMSTGGGTGNTFRNKNGSTNVENNWRGQSTNPTIEGSMGASQGETSRSGVGSSLSQTGGNSNKVSNSDNRLANYNSMSKQEQEVVDAILKTSSSARADIEGKYNPAIEKYEEKYKQLKSETSEVGGRLLYLGDVTGAGAAYPKQALDSTSKTAKMNIQQFLNRFNTTNPELQGGLKDISVKHGLFNQGPVDSNMKKRVDQLSNPAIADILDGKTYLPAISNMIQGKLPDVQYEAEKSMYDAEAPLRMEQTKGLDQSDPNFWAKYEGAIKSAATNSPFGKAVMAAKVLKAHDDLTQFFTNPSANPAENMMGDKRTLAPFNQYLDRLFNAAVMDPKANTVLGATGMEMALRISPYRQELTRIQNLNPVFTDPKNEATKYMIRALADPTNRDVYLQKVKDLDPERYRGIGKPYAPVGNAPARSVPANPAVPAARGIMFQDGKPLLFK